MKMLSLSGNKNEINKEIAINDPIMNSSLTSIVFHILFINGFIINIIAATITINAQTAPII